MLFSRCTNRRLGFTLIELAIVLGVVGVLSAGLWRLMSSGSQATKDQAAAQQQSVLIAAVKGYLSDLSTNNNGAVGGQGFLTNLGGSAVANIPLPGLNDTLAHCMASYGGSASPLADLCNFLPTGFVATTTNPYGHTYAINVLKDASGPGTAPSSFSFMIETAGTTIPDADGARISSLIGGDGGFVYANASVCGGAGTACGTMGGWQSTSAAYGLPGTVGTIASRTFVSSSANSSYEWLARVAMSGDTPVIGNGTYTYSSTPNYNTTTTDLFFGKTGAMSGGVTPEPIYAGVHLQYGLMDGAGSNQETVAQISLNDIAMGATPFAPLISLNSCTQAGGVPGSCSVTGSAIDIVQGDIYVNGQITGSKLYSSSDARFKKDIRPLKGELANVMKLDPVAFTFRAGGSQSMGVIAQELEQVYPQLVLDEKGRKYVEYNGLIGPLIASVQELKQENDSLKDQLNQQAAMQKKLEKEIHSSASP